MDSTGSRQPFVQQRPPFPAPASSTTSSASQSSSSLSTLPSASAFAAPSSRQHPSSSVAPMPPSSPVQKTHPFGSLHADNMAAAQAAQAQRSQPQMSRTTSWDYRPDREAAGRTAPEMLAFLKDNNLVAEAAKRAQMAVLMRDMEGVELS